MFNLHSFTGFIHATAELGELVFQDDFQRLESQEKKDEPGKGWGTNSAKRAHKDKQVDSKDGAMRIYIVQVLDHAVSLHIPSSL